MKKILLDNESVTIENRNGILFVTGKDNIVTLEVVKRVVKYRLEVAAGDKFPLVSDIKKMKSISKEARDFLGSPKGSEGILAAAVLIDSAIGSMLGDFFIKITKPLVPTKIFTNEKTAIAWLSQFV